jgi:NDP-sugar pyrophosphorylase family protein
MMKDSDVFTGTNCHISPNAAIRDSVLWDDITIGDDVSLYRTIIADGVTIEPGEHFENAAIVRAEMVRNCEEIPEKALKGYIQGENYVVPLN